MMIFRLLEESSAGTSSGAYFDHEPFARLLLLGPRSSYCSCYARTTATSHTTVATVARLSLVRLAARILKNMMCVVTILSLVVRTSNGRPTCGASKYFLYHDSTSTTSNTSTMIEARRPFDGRAYY